MGLQIPLELIMPIFCIGLGLVGMVVKKDSKERVLMYLMVTSLGIVSVCGYLFLNSLY